MKLIILAILLFVTLSCNSNSKQKVIKNKLDTTILQKERLNEEDTFVKNSIDTARYLGLPYYDTTMNHPGSQGYIDTFTIHNFKFRIIHQDTMFDGVVEKYQNSQWYRIMNFENLGNHNDYDVSNDLDGDGNNDLIFNWKWYGEIHFFDTTKNEFSDKVNCTMSNDWALLNTANHIYFENIFGKLMQSPVSSKLFTFKEKKKVEIATLIITFNPEDIDYRFIKGEIHLNKEKAIIEKIVPNEKISIEDFDYLKFWADHYKKLMNFHKNNEVE